MRAKSVFLIVIAALCALVVFVVTQNEASPLSLGTEEFNLRIEDRRIVEGDALLRVDEGSTVVIRLTSDEAEEFHLHGYDRSVDLVPNTEVSLTFVADASGRFTFELEKSKTELGALEVRP